MPFTLLHCGISDIDSWHSLLICSVLSDALKITEWQFDLWIYSFIRCKELCCLLIMSKHVADMSVSCLADNNAFVIYVMCCVQKILALYNFFPEPAIIQNWRPHWYMQCLGQSFWCALRYISILQNTGGNTFWFRGVSLICVVWRVVTVVSCQV